MRIRAHVHKVPGRLLRGGSSFVRPEAYIVCRSLFENTNYKNKTKYKTLERAPVSESPKAHPSLALDSKPAHEYA